MTQSLLIWITVLTMLLPLMGALMAGLFGHALGRRGTHRITIGFMSVAFLLSSFVFLHIVVRGYPGVDTLLYHWVASGLYQFDVGILIDRLSVTMMVVVTFVSLMVHIYTIGYMANDPGYQRFFSYMSLFTFAMLTLVLANNFLLMFFGWEGVGLVSYLLIGFWFTRESAVMGSLKAFIVNRVGDVGFVLAIAAILMHFNSLNYSAVFSHVNSVVGHTVSFLPGKSVEIITLICLLLFIGAMAKSAQMPLHVWLPESMEGPTPISALIHAATMVTAGIYMVARLSPLFEYSTVALSVILVIGGTTCLFMGFLALTQYDIKRVIAYSTISQLGYMTVALGASAYDAAIFHLITHAFFKALLFLAAGSVIIALHHEQDMRKMGGLAWYMPVTYFTFLMGACSLAALPPFAGFFSKDTIIEAVHFSSTPGAAYAYLCVLIGAFITPLYIFRAFFLTFHGTLRMNLHEPVRESPSVVCGPLLVLTIPSIIAGVVLVTPMLFSIPKLLGNSIFVLPQHDVLALVARDDHGALEMIRHAFFTATCWLAFAGIAVAWTFSLVWPKWTDVLKKRFAVIYFILIHKYGFDAFNQWVFVRGIRRMGQFFYEIGDLKLIDGIFVNGSGKGIRWFSQLVRYLQTGYVYHYAFAMMVGLALFLSWFLL